MIALAPPQPDLRALRAQGEALLHRAEDLNAADSPMDDLLARHIAHFAAAVDRPVAGPPTPQAAVELLFGLLEVVHRRLFPVAPVRRRRKGVPIRTQLLEDLSPCGAAGMLAALLIGRLGSGRRDGGRRELAAMEAAGLVRTWSPERGGRRVALAEPPRTAGGEGR